MNIVNNTKNLISTVLEYINQTPWRGLYKSRLEMLIEKAEMQCELAIIGRVKAGKSSFLNALLGEDLAMVGTTETTATINYFKYGVPEDAAHPVQVIWEDGHDEWQTFDFLNSLQGNSPEVLEKANHIDHLVYYLPNPILRNITLVDTPGTDALVDEHLQRTKEYLSSQHQNLRQKHHRQSVQLKERADAVIVIVEHVPTASTRDIVAKFTDNTSALNSLGVMTKIDTEDVTKEDWHRRSREYTNMLRQQLHSIQPVSAGLFRAVNQLQKENRLEWMQEKLRLIPKEENYFDELVKDRTVFLDDSDDVCELFDGFGLSLKERKLICENLDFRVFYVIAKALYNYPVDQAVSEILDYSGMNQVSDILEKQFFNRSRTIRCAKILREIQDILNQIQNKELPEITFVAKNKKEFINICDCYNDKSKNYIVKLLKNFIENNVCSTDDCEQYKANVYELQQKVEQLLLSVSGSDNKCEALILLEHQEHFFSPAEIDELEALFEKRTWGEITINKSSIGQRVNYWRAKKCQYRGNRDVERIIELALYAYGTIKIQ